MYKLDEGVRLSINAVEVTSQCPREKLLNRASISR